jgi:hypothetical protein
MGMRRAEVRERVGSGGAGRRVRRFKREGEMVTEDLCGGGRRRLALD